MDDKTLEKREFCVDDFVRIYLETAIVLANDYNGQSFEMYENRLRKDVARKTGLSLNAVKYLHHSFHWVLFNDNDSKIKQQQGIRSSSESLLRLKNGYENQREFRRSIDLFRKNDYSAYLESRVIILEKSNRLYEDVVQNSKPDDIAVKLGDGKLIL